MHIITNTADPATTPVASAVECFDVSFGFTSARDVLHDISVTVPVGCTFAVLGPNGAGKSTLLELIAGLRTPRRGTLRVGDVRAIEQVGRVVAHCTPPRILATLSGVRSS